MDNSKLIDPGLITFKAVIHQTESGRGGAFVEFPFDLKKLYGIGNLVPVIAQFDGISYQGSIAKMGPKPILIIKKEIREKLNKTRGDPVNVTVKLDTTPRTVEVPMDVQDLLANHPHEKEIFEKLAYSHQKEYVDWINSTKRPETKTTRLAKLIEHLNKEQKF